MGQRSRWIRAPNGRHHLRAEGQGYKYTPTDELVDVTTKLGLEQGLRVLNVFNVNGTAEKSSHWLPPAVYQAKDGDSNTPEFLESSPQYRVAPVNSVVWSDGHTGTQARAGLNAVTAKRRYASA